MIKKLINWNIKNKGTKLVFYAIFIGFINGIFFKLEPMNSEIGTLIHYFVFSMVMLGAVLKFLYAISDITDKYILYKLYRIMMKINVVVFALGFIMMFVKFLLTLSAFFK